MALSGQLRHILKDDLFYFEQAMILAREAFKHGYSPVGAVLVCNGERVAARKSQREIGNFNHAEFLTLYGFKQRKLPPNWENDLTLYSTLEPCLMCCGMATILHVDHIKWLVDDIWAGTRLLNYNMPYVQERFPRMDRIDLPDLHLEAQEMWVKYLRATGHADAVSFMLGLSEDYELQGPLLPYYAQGTVK